jgi:hypothetical protein
VRDGANVYLTSSASGRRGGDGWRTIEGREEKNDQCQPYAEYDEEAPGVRLRELPPGFARRSADRVQLVCERRVGFERSAGDLVAQPVLG